MQTEFISPFNQPVTLQRFPEPRGIGREMSLRAWDAADEYLLQYLSDHYADRLKPGFALAIYNDAFGALSSALHSLRPLVVSDSWLAHAACQYNLQANGIDASQLQWLTSLETPSTTLDMVLLKIPKSYALLEDQLYRLRPHLTANTIIVAAGMIKSLSSNCLKLFETILGPTTTSLAQKKARLIFCKATNISNTLSPYPIALPLPDYNLQLCNHANVFAREKLDIGTRFFIEHLPATQGATDIIDLGCGNGLLGLIAAQKNPAAHIHFTDESYMAIASAKENVAQNTPHQQTSFYINNSLDAFSANSADLILNNPPFHQQQVVGDHIARQMFIDAKKVLKKGGELWVVGNRHLQYHQQLQRLFGNCKLVASNTKFVILQARKSA